jgi:hypothetical protein
MSYASFDPNSSTSDPNNSKKYREWELQPQSEYRFELAPNTSIGIKVRGRRGPRYAPGSYFTDECVCISSWMGMPSVLESNSPQGYLTCSEESAKPSFTPTADAHWR